MDLNEARKFFSGDAFAVEQAGAAIEEIGDGYALCSMEYGEKHLNAAGTVMGGAIFTLADFAFAAACNSWGEKVTGINMSIQCLKAVRSGTLTARAKEVARTRKLSTCEVAIRDERDQLVALFQGTGYVLGGSLLD